MLALWWSDRRMMQMTLVQKFGLALVVMLALGIGGWLGWRQQSSAPRVGTPTTAGQATLISSQEYDQLAAQPEVFVIDVHTPEQPHLPGTDAVIPFDQLQLHQNELPADKTTPLVVYCRSGGMSRQASQDLAALGYTTVYDLEGGAQQYHQQSARIYLTPTTQDLGTVVYGDVATTSFELINATAEEVTVTRVSTSCSCTSAQVAETTIQPGESTQVTVSFDPAVHGDATDVGAITRSIYLETDHPESERVTATITATVVLAGAED